MGDEAGTAMLQDMLVSFRQRYTAATAFREDRERAAEIAAEARPVLEAISASLRTGELRTLDDFEHCEGLAQLRSLGRRCAICGISLSAALTVAPALLATLQACELPAPGTLHSSFQAIFLEGYLAGQEERFHAERAKNAVHEQVRVRLSPTCLALFLHGDQSPEVWQEIAEEFGRELLQNEAQACIVDLMHAHGGAACAHEIFALDSTARLLGVRCFFTRVSREWRRSAEQAGIDLEHVDMRDSFEEALCEIGIGRRTVPAAGRLGRIFQRIFR